MKIKNKISNKNGELSDHEFTLALNLYQFLKPHLDNGAKLCIKEKDGKSREVKIIPLK